VSIDVLQHFNEQTVRIDTKFEIADFLSGEFQVRIRLCYFEGSIRRDPQMRMTEIRYTYTIFMGKASGKRLLWGQEDVGMSYVFVGAGFPMHRDLMWSIVRPL
jgi:hypothetical protein